MRESYVYRGSLVLSNDANSIWSGTPNYQFLVCEMEESGSYEPVFHSVINQSAYLISDFGSLSYSTPTKMKLNVSEKDNLDRILTAIKSVSSGSVLLRFRAND